MTSELEKTKAELEAVRQQLYTAVAERDELRVANATLVATADSQSAAQGQQEVQATPSQ
jgi:regulator of replication initiation timing